MDLTHSPTVTAIIRGRHHPRHGGVHEPRQREPGVDKRTDIGVWLRALRDAGRPVAVARGTVTDTLARSWTASRMERAARIHASHIGAGGPLLDKDPQHRLRDVATRASISTMCRRRRAASRHPAGRAPAGYPGWCWAALVLPSSRGRQHGGLQRGRPWEGQAWNSRASPNATGPAREFGRRSRQTGGVAYVSNVSGSTTCGWVSRRRRGREPHRVRGPRRHADSGVSGLDISPTPPEWPDGQAAGSTTPFSSGNSRPLPGVPRKLLDDGFLGMRGTGRPSDHVHPRGAAAGDSLW